MIDEKLLNYLELSQEVIEAKEKGLPIVALESTIISHGMPHPQNVTTARNVENIIREGGAIPATIAILNGKIKIGLNNDELEYLGKAREVVKASRRDLPFVITNQLDGATTVAATMICADLAEIRVFVTGGIGGVHRGAEESMDISADLTELSNTNIAVVCAGVKSILDIGLTLEYLETLGVPIIGVGTDELPAFYVRKSDFFVDYRFDDMENLARALKVKWDLGLNGGLVIANPIPTEFEMNHNEITNAIENALNEAREKGIKGKDTTPFLLAKVKRLRMVGV